MRQDRTALHITRSLKLDEQQALLANIPRFKTTFPEAHIT
jgi:hypothetical protein